MRMLAFAAAAAVSLTTMTSAIADRSMHDVDRIQQSSEVRDGAHPDRQACNDIFADVTSPSCGAATPSAPRPAWRGLN